MRPARVASLRRELLEWLDSPDAESYYAHMASDEGTWNRADQAAVLAAAELFFISEDMSAVAVVAGQSMPDQVPLKAEFPAEAGFACWDGPLVAEEVVDELLDKHPKAKLISTTQVLSWTMRRLHYYQAAEPEHPRHDEYREAAAELPEATHPDELDNPEARRSEGSAEPLSGDAHQHDDGSPCDRPLIDVAHLTFWVKPEGRTFPPLIPYHSAVLDLTIPIRASARDDNVGGNEAAGAWIEHFDMSVYTTLVLMGQTVADVTTESPDRAERRRSAREGIEVRDVRVVQLRRARSEAEAADHDVATGDGSAASKDDGPQGVEWRRRWVVRGHWRQQWYPSLGDHRQVWIHSYVKGPEDQPLVAGATEIVNALTR